MELKDFIHDRLNQLENRKMMIPRYLKMPGGFLGKKDFSLDDLPKIELEINKCKACLKALSELKP